MHWTVAKHILRCLARTIDYGLDYSRLGGVGLVGFTNLDWAGSASNQKSTSDCCFSLGLTIVSLFSRKQGSVALSSAEAEYMAASQASCEALWLHKLMVDLFG